MNWAQRLLGRLRRPAPEIPDTLWLQALHDCPMLSRRPLADVWRLRQLSARFLQDKEFSVAGDLELDDRMALAIAAQACVPVIHLDLSLYDGFVGIVIQPGEVDVQRSWSDEIGLVHSRRDTLSGEIVPGGPVMLSWPDVQRGRHAMETGYNVVIHEFAHVIDAADGHVDGLPPMPDRATQERWLRVRDAAFERLVQQADEDRPGVLDPYGAESLEEFFPVACESYFSQGRRLRRAEPELYQLLSDYFRQDSAAFL